MLNVVDLILQKQRYEGASTIYGPHTHEAYLNEFSQVSGALAKVVIEVIFFSCKHCCFSLKYLTLRALSL